MLRGGALRWRCFDGLVGKAPAGGGNGEERGGELVESAMPLPSLMEGVIPSPSLMEGVIPSP